MSVEAENETRDILNTDRLELIAGLLTVIAKVLCEMQDEDFEMLLRESM